MSASLSKIVDVNVSVNNPSTISSDFNLGLIIGNSNSDIPNGLKIYSFDSYKTQMVADGFETTDPEYKAAEVYFSQKNRSSRLAIAYYDTTKQIASEFNRIRALNDQFYVFCVVGEVSDANIASLAAAVESSSIPTQFIFHSSNANCITASTTNIMKTIRDAGYTRSFGFYSTDENVDAAFVGLICGLNSMAANSSYTAAYKTLVGVAAMDLNDSQLEILSDYNGNAYTKFGNKYSFTYPCVSGGGYHVDEIFLLDVSKHLIQQNVVVGLTSARKIPQTESGVTDIISFISDACRTLQNMGLISSGIWRGDSVKSLKAGDAVENGYYIEADRVSSQTAAERASRVSPTIYVALLASGAIESVVINVYVNR